MVDRNWLNARNALADAGYGAIDHAMAGTIIYNLDGAGWELAPDSRISKLEAERDRLREALSTCANLVDRFLYTQREKVEGEGPHYTFPDGATVRRVGKKAAGRTLDVVTHDALPEV